MPKKTDFRKKSEVVKNDNVEASEEEKVAGILDECSINNRPFKQLQDNDTVIIINFNNDTLFVRNDECKELYNKICGDILNYNEKLFPMEAEVSDTVLTRYEDGGDLHRAVILSKSRKNVDVDFIDLGFTETVPVDNLYTISDSLSKETCSAIPIYNFLNENEIVSTETWEFLNSCCDNKIEFRVFVIIRGIYDGKEAISYKRVFNTADF